MKQLLMIGTLLAGLAGLLGATTAQAITIGFVPPNQTVNVTDAVSIDVVVSGLEAGGLDEVVSSFDLDITYDTSILLSTGATFGMALDAGLFGSLQSDSSVPGIEDLAEISFEFDSDLQALQGDSVTLGTLNFNAIGAGITSLTFVFNPPNELTGLVSPINGFPAVLDVTATSGEITVIDPNVPPIPEPSTIVLFGTGLAGLAAWRLRKQ